VSPSEPAAVHRIDPDQLFREHQPALVRYLARLVGDPEAAADAAQEAFVRLLERPPAPDAIRAWLFRVATNAALQSARTRARRLQLLEDDPASAPMGTPPPSPDAALEADERVRLIRRALDGLAERDRIVLLMREEGFTHREIAGAVGTTTGSIGTMVARALEKLARQLDLDEEEI
jgi:RNA polymerase sigma factor (sigma-70 family)